MNEKIDVGGIENTIEEEKIMEGLFGD